MEVLLNSLAQSWISRPDDLKELDSIRENDAGWFQLNQMLGGVCYVDLFTGNLAGKRALAFATFSEEAVILPGNLLRISGLSYQLQELISGTQIWLADILLGPFQLAIYFNEKLALQS